LLFFLFINIGFICVARMTEAQYEAYMEAEFYSYMGMNHSHHSHHDEGHFSTDCEPDAYLAPTSSLKSRIPWLSSSTSAPDDSKDETRSMILDVITKMKLTTEEGVLMSGLLNNLQDMFPNYLPNRLLLLFGFFPAHHILKKMQSIHKNKYYGSSNE
jgi:hypothetical protein